MKRQLPQPVAIGGGEQQLLPTRNLPVAPAPYKPKPIPRKARKKIITHHYMRVREPWCFAGHNVPECLKEDPYCCSDCYRVVLRRVEVEEDCEDWEVDMEDS